MFDLKKFDDVTFVSNDESDMSCVSATFTMILSKLRPQLKLSLEDVVKLSGALPGKAVWPSQMLIELKAMGLESVLIEAFDASRFIKEGGEYLRSEYGDETADWQITNSDIPKEQADYKRMLGLGVKVETRIPSTENIREYLGKSWMVRCIVNANTLSGKSGYVGHSVLVLDMNDTHVLLHNPGLPPVPFQEIPIDLFNAAWASPNEKVKEMIAVR